MKLVTPEEAVREIPPHSRLVAHQGCAQPVTLWEALAAQAGRLQGMHLYLGLYFGDTDPLERCLAAGWKATAWIVTERLRPYVAQGRIGYLPARYRELPRIFARDGPLPVDVVLLQVSPPGEEGQVSLGVSVGPFLELAQQAPMVVAEVNDQMPPTAGNSQLAVEDITLGVRVSHPLVTQPTSWADGTARQIAAHVLPLIPQGAWVQLGIGRVPEALAEVLAERRGVNLHSGVLSDGAVRLVARGRRAITSEVVGSGGLFDFVRRNPSVQLHPCTYTHDPALLASLPHFVTVNSALEVDLTGQVNAESLNREVVSGVGGSLDFVEGARRSRSGLVVVALPSTTADGRGSRIVPTLSRGAVVTIPRSCVDTVVTEYGVADLRGKDLRERADALLQVAHPDFREVLRRKCFP